MTVTNSIAVVNSLRPASVADQVFEYLYQQILSVKLPPGSKLSEVEVSKQMGVSRQPVREAFFRLSQMGFVLVRPQRATIVMPISEKKVSQSMVIRKALETEAVHCATAVQLKASALALLDDLLVQQQRAIDADNYPLFFQLDDQFHQSLCEAANVNYIWTLIEQQTVQMARVRFLSLSFGAQISLNEHRQVFDAISSGNNTLAIESMREHLSHLHIDMPRLRAAHPAYFTD